MKKERFKLGIIYNFSFKWMGGIIYILNVIKMLDFLDDEEKPEIFLFYRPDLKKFLSELNYPYLNAFEWTFPTITSGYLKSWITGRNMFIDAILNSYNLDALYPLHDYPVKAVKNVKLVSWYADLQHKYYPEFFSVKKRLERDARIKLILRHSDDLVISSNAVAYDFKRFFKIRSDLKMHIFHFVSIVDWLDSERIPELKQKYKLPDKYFMISNQFHKHKNHKVILQASAALKKEGINLFLVMTGKLPDAAQSPYMEELHRIIEKDNLHENIRFLGVISRNDQLLLMKHSQAVIQPSLFEGWSTVIEDAISLQVPVVASNLPVNIEQLGPDGVYFDPLKPEELVAILAHYPERNLSDIFYEEYHERVKKAAIGFMKIFR
ncbi:MAG: glycosyltransferase family 4 protein [Bacteroidales bacterium]|nr:glycosyltransferase family 4 protein [Bacteroidales bacterium]